MAIYSFMFEFLIIDFSYHDFASYLILLLIAGILAHLLAISLFVFLVKLSANLNTFSAVINAVLPYSKFGLIKILYKFVMVYLGFYIFLLLRE